MILITFAIVCVTLLILLLIEYVRRPYRSIPGPFCLPVLGTKWSDLLLPFSKSKYERQHVFYQEMFRQHGPVIREEAFMNYPIISISAKTDIEKVLKDGGRKPIRPPVEMICHYRQNNPKKYTNSGLTNEQGDKWICLRNILAPLVRSSKSIEFVTPKINKLANDFIRKIKRLRNSDNIINRFDELLNLVCLDGISMFILGRKLNLQPDDADLDDPIEIAERLNDSNESTESSDWESGQLLADAIGTYFRSIRDSYYGLKLWKIIKTPTYKNYTRSEETMYDAITEMMNRVDLTNDSVIGNISRNSQLNNLEKRVAIIDFISGGIQTISNTFIYLLYLLAKNPEAQQKLYEELKSTKSQSNPARPYMEACLMECYRLLPTATCVARVTQSNLVLSGHFIHEKTVVLCHTAVACRDPQNFPEPNEFQPERWIDKDRKMRSDKSRIIIAPFGHGNRMCPGKMFVDQELEIFLETFLLEFEIGFPYKQLERTFQFLLIAKGPLSFIFKNRN